MVQVHLKNVKLTVINYKEMQDLIPPLIIKQMISIKRARLGTYVTNSGWLDL